jgi:CRISPR system Cascade subunit CasB
VEKNKKTDLFAPDGILGDKILKWWNELQKQYNSGNRAMLRRANDAMEVAMQPAYYDFLKMIREEYRRESLPFIAGILSHVRSNDPVVLPKAIGFPKDQPVVSDLRFRKILRMEKPDELLYLTILRFIKMNENKAHVLDLAKSIYYWNDKTRKKWAEEYYLGKEIQEEIEIKEEEGVTA